MATKADREQLRTEGWVVVEAVAAPDRLASAIDAICAFHELSLDDPSTWARIPLDSWDMVPVHHAQAIWDNRSLPLVHAAFADLLGARELWVSMDRSGFKVPSGSRPELDRLATIHWDAKPRERLTDPTPWLQGMLYLTDTSLEQGAFECVPSLYRGAATWLNEHADGSEPDVTGRPIVRVPGKAGDLVIWNALLPHRGGRNDGASPRVTQYISMFPVGTHSHSASERVALWRDKRVPPSYRDWPATVIDPEPGPRADLDPLGRKLLGLDPW